MGSSGLAIAIATANPPVPNGEIFNLFSGQTQIPTGAGELFGNGLDAFPQFFTALDASSLVRTLLNPQGGRLWSFPAGIPAGFHIEAVSVLNENFQVSRVRTASTIQF